MADGTERLFPRGALIVYREWYGCQLNEDGTQKPDAGLKLDVEKVGAGIKARETSEVINEQMSPADGSMWDEDGGPSLYERMTKINDGKGPRFKKADKSRATGWQQVRGRLNGEDGHPMLYVTEDCIGLLRTLPALQHDEHKPEDVDSDMEDHAPDALRYMCMARPWSTVKKPKAPTGPAPWSLDWVLANG
jgi:hypothetical protein